MLEAEGSIDKYVVSYELIEVEREEQYNLSYHINRTIIEEYYKLRYEQYSYDLIQYADVNYIIEKLENIENPYTYDGVKHNLILLIISILGIIFIVKIEKNRKFE